jgi:hypothetical protein
MKQDQYKEVFHSFESLLEYAVSLFSELGGPMLNDERLTYADSIFKKLTGHAISLRALSPDPEQKQSRELWDLSSVSAIARALIQTYDVLAYIVFNPVGASEREFRTLLWKLHDQERRQKMLDHIGSKNPEIAEIHANIICLRPLILQHPFVSNISNRDKQKISDGDAPAFCLNQRDRCIENKIDHAYYTAATMHLSQYVHTFPFAVQRLSNFRAGEPDALRDMALCLRYSTHFLAKAIDGMHTLCDWISVKPSEYTEDQIQTSIELLANGLKAVE